MRRLGGLLLEGGANVCLNGRRGRSIFVHEGRRSCWSSADTWHHIFEYERKRVEHSSTRLLECGGVVGEVRCVRLQPIWTLHTVKSETNSRLPLPYKPCACLKSVPAELDAIPVFDLTPLTFRGLVLHFNWTPQERVSVEGGKVHQTVKGSIAHNRQAWSRQN
jgi:hypothetical protein